MSRLCEAYTRGGGTQLVTFDRGSLVANKSALHTLTKEYGLPSVDLSTLRMREYYPRYIKDQEATSAAQKERERTPALEGGTLAQQSEQVL